MHCCKHCVYRCVFAFTNRENEELKVTIWKKIFDKLLKLYV